MDPGKESISVGEFLTEQLETSLKRLLKRMTICREKFEENSVHNLRVSIRRLLSNIFLIENLIQSPYILELKSVLKKTLKSFNDLRDTQVLILSVKANIGEFPNLRDKLTLFPDTDLKGMILFLKLDLKAKSSGKAFDKDNLSEILHRSYKIYRFMHLQSSRYAASSFHSVRIALKRLRYLSEVLQKQFNIRDEKIKKLKVLQTILGELQDACVFQANLEKFVLSCETGNLLNYKQTFMHIKNKQESLIREYYVNCEEVINLMDYPLSVE
jgi:CHAD domain-containing protein